MTSLPFSSWLPITAGQHCLSESTVVAKSSYTFIDGITFTNKCNLPTQEVPRMLVATCFLTIKNAVRAGCLQFATDDAIGCQEAGDNTIRGCYDAPKQLMTL